LESRKLTLNYFEKSGMYITTPFTVLFGACTFLVHVKLIAFELAGEDRDRRENPVLSRFKIAFFALHKRG
jgi:hypothetical protein